MHTWILSLLAGALLAASASADVVVAEVHSDSVVYDHASNAYWYRNLPDLLGMTKAEQRSFISSLNEDRYAGRNNWAFATLAQVTALMDSMAEGAERHGDAVVRRWSVRPDYYFVATQYIDAEAQRDSLPVGSHWLYCGRTADERVIREDLINEPPWYTEHEQYGEGQYHFPLFDYFGNDVVTDGVLDMIMYDYDVNFMADDATTSPAPRSTDPTSNMPPLQCAAWLVSVP